MQTKNNFCITLDIDWAADDVIINALNLFSDYGIKATLFFTHYTELIKDIDRKMFEVAIHPNFQNVNLANCEEILTELLGLFPESKGFRSHGLVSSSNILFKAGELGIIYDSNTYLPGYKNIKPIERFRNFFTIPYNFSDSDSLYNKRERVYEMKNVSGMRGLRVFTFHPIHIFLNTESLEHYERAKKHNRDITQLSKMINTKNGVKDDFENLLHYMKKNNLSGKKCKELIKEA